MIQSLQSCLGRFGLLLVFVLINTGCNALSAILPASAEPNTPPIQADVTALEVIVERLRDGNTVALQKQKSVDIQVNDQISVKEYGRGLLRFPDRLQVELFRDTDALLRETSMEPSGPIFVRLKQIFGHSRIELNSVADARITLETDYATITALDSNTEFLVCHAEALTCMVTVKGEVEVEAQGVAVHVKGGESTYIFPGHPPQPAICANLAEVEQWLNRKRGSEEVEALGQLVVGWPQEPCASTPPPEPTISSAELPTPDRMVRIEGGPYKVGSLQPDNTHLAAQEITASSFWIDQYEVTNAEYKQFLDQVSQPAPLTWPGGVLPPGRETHPIKGITWDQADAYCAWAKKRLPSEAEWEIAARGPGSEPPLYPWGPDPGAGGQAQNLPLTDTYAVGSMPFNQSPFGVYDLVGNVWEWVGEPYGPLPAGQKILRGGRHGLLKDMAYRELTEPNNDRFVAFAGFRCATDQVEGE